MDSKLAILLANKVHDRCISVPHDIGIELAEIVENHIKNQSHFNDLSPAEAERLSCLIEEVGEALQVIGKVQRHGYESFHPDRPKITNRMLLEKELGDTFVAVEKMYNTRDVNNGKILDHMAEKRISIKPYLHHQD